MTEKIIGEIEETEKSGNLIEIDPQILSGFSGRKVLGSLQRLMRLFEGDDDACYLEIGVYQGLTLLSVAKACPRSNCFGIDNFSFLDPDNKNLGLIEERRKKLMLSNVELINQDYEDALENLSQYIKDKKIAVYFIDGPHDYRNQLMCLQLAKPYLHKNAVILIDDSNYQHVRQANRDFLVTEPTFKLIFEAYTPYHPINMKGEYEKKAREGWWNGINIIVKDAENRLQSMFPPTQRNRILFENDHITHSMALAEYAPLSLRILHILVQFKFIKFTKILIKHLNHIRKLHQRTRPKFYNAITYSEQLPSFNINQLISKF